MVKYNKLPTTPASNASPHVQPLIYNTYQAYLRRCAVPRASNLTESYSLEIYRLQDTRTPLTQPQTRQSLRLRTRREARARGVPLAGSQRARLWAVSQRREEWLIALDLAGARRTRVDDEGRD